MQKKKKQIKQIKQCISENIYNGRDKGNYKILEKTMHSTPDKDGT